MPQSLPVITPHIEQQFDACVHCGLCLPVCPTYVETQDEADSPRGRIHLMRAAVDGRIGMSDAVFEHLDRCLVCRACETACPSGVSYHEIIETVRPQVADAVLGKGKKMRSSSLAWLVERVLPYPKRAAAAMLPLRLAEKAGLGKVLRSLTPHALRGAMALLPEDSSGTAAQLPAFTPAQAPHRGSVVLLRGCVGSVISATTNAACIQVLSANGFDVHLVAGGSEPCCGALAAHGNNPAQARDFAMHMIDTLERQPADAYITPIAGCGAQLKSLGKVLEEFPTYHERAKKIASQIRDISEFLVQSGLRTPAKPLNRTVTYHEPCHLTHGQRLGDMPRKLLAAIPGLKIVPLTESDMCCGAAGTYSLNQPDMADQLGRRKVAHILETSSEELITANIGCALQIARHLKLAGQTMRVRHVVELIAETL